MSVYHGMRIAALSLIAPNTASTSSASSLSDDGGWLLRGNANLTFIEIDCGGAMQPEVDKITLAMQVRMPMHSAALVRC